MRNKKITILFVVLILNALVANAFNSKNVDEAARIIAGKILKTFNDNQKLRSKKNQKHIIDASANIPDRYSTYYLNNGEAIWNLTNSAKSDINSHINSYSSVFNDVEYFIVIGSVFKYQDIESDVKDIDWKELQNAKKLKKGKVADQAFFDAVKSKVEATLSLNNFPAKYILNWYLTVFTEGANGDFVIQTFSYLRNKSGYSSPNVSFASVNSAFDVSSTSMSKTEWIKKNVDIDANTIKYIKQFETSYLINSTSKSINSDETLRKMLNGESSYTENSIIYRNLRLIVLLTEDGITSKEDSIAMTGLKSTTHTIIWLHYSNSKWRVQSGYPKFPNDQSSLLTEALVKQLFYEKTTTFWERFGDNLSSYQNDFLVSLYDAMDWLSKGIEKAMIPERVWNCCVSDYDSKYANFFGYFLSPFSKIIEGVSGNTIGNISTASCANATMTKAQFAMYVGIWNGFIGVVKAIPDGIKMLSSAGIDQKYQTSDPVTGMPIRNDWGVMKNAIYKESSYFLVGLLKVVGASLKEMHDPNLPCLFSYSVGNDILMIAAAFFTGGETIAGSAASSVTRQLFLTLERLDIISQVIGKIGGVTAKYVLRPVLSPVAGVVKQSLVITWKELNSTVKEVYEIVIENGKVLIKIYDAANNVLKNFNWSYAKQASVKVLLPDGSSATLRIGFPNISLNGLARDIAELKKDITLEIKDVIKDKDGNTLANEYGQGIVVVKDPSTGDELIGVIDDADNVGNGVINSSPDVWKLSLQNLGKPASGTILGENLISIGKIRPENSHAHHITAGGASNVDAVNSRLILQRENIDINEAANGVFLPSSSKYAVDNAIPHANVHTNLYYRTVFDRLNAAPSGKVRDELLKIADELLNGTFPY